MTTGPFNIIGNLKGDGLYSHRAWGTGIGPEPPIVWRHSVVISRRRLYKRDKSHSNPPTRNHWREPTAWYSKGYSTISRPGCMFVVSNDYYDIAGPFKRTTEDRLVDGYGAADVDTSLPPIDTAKWQDVTLTKALLKLKNQHVNIANAFGERQETARMFEDVSKAAITGLGNFQQSIDGKRLVKGGPRLRFHNAAARRKSWAKLKNVLVKDLPASMHNHWLQYIYGMAPLMQDLYGSMEALAYREFDGNAYRVTVKSSHKEAINTSFFIDYLASLGSTSSYKGGFQQDTTTNYFCHTSLTYVMVNPFLRSLAQLGITNPATLWWELTRLSFVVDWLLPVGDYLSTWDADFGWRFLGGTTSHTYKQTAEFKPVTVSHSFPVGTTRKNDYNVFFTGSKPAFSGHQMSRVKYLSSPLPRMPRLKNPLSMVHVANAVALLRGAFSS